jgi:hypothetical protein
MAISVLFELNQELTRLFVAGSRLASGDPRIKKFIAPLKKYGEKSPVFQRLAQHIEELSEIDANLSAQKLIETEIFLLSVLSTQGNALPEETADIKDTDYAQETFGETKTAYRTLSPLMEALTTTGSGRFEIIEQAFKGGAFNDPRIYKPAADAVGDKYGEIADYMVNTVLPSMRGEIVIHLLDGYDVKGGAFDGRRLAAIYKIKGENALNLVEEAVENGSAAVKAEAVKIMGDYPGYEQLLLSMLGEKTKALREEVMKSLVKMDSKEGIDKLIEIYNGDKKNSTVLSALSYGTSSYLTDELLKCAYADYETLKNELDNFSADSKEAIDSVAGKKLRLHNDITALYNKDTDETVEFYKTILSDEYLVKAQTIAQSVDPLDDYVLRALHSTGKGDDFIWKMFEDAHFRVTSKVKKPKGLKKSGILLDCYAFGIGAERLKPEEFYGMFFETGLYKDMVKNKCNHSYYLFQNTFLRDEKSPELSPKVARYFLEHMNKDHYHLFLAAQIVQPGDFDSLDLLVKHYKNNLSKNSYYFYHKDILKRLGEAGHKDFKKLYGLFDSQKHDINAEDTAYLEQFLTE